MSHTPQHIREVLIQHFNEEELRIVCADHFPKAHNDWADSDSLTAKAQKLVSYCQKRDLLDDLIHAIEAERPNALGAGGTQPNPLCALRPPTPNFVGREVELAALAAQLTGENANAVAITSASSLGIAGMGGVGKTELALALAWRVQDHFPDAQLLVPLAANSGGTPLTPMGAMEFILRAFHPGAGKLPDDERDLLQLLHAELRGKRCLIIFDDAADDAQLTPLLPLPAGNAALITTRQRLQSVPQTQLDVLPSAEATQLLQRYRPTLSATDGTALAEAVGCLPIALHVLGGFLNQNESWTPARYLRQLEKQKLDELKADRRLAQDDPRKLDVRAVFETSYRTLPPALQTAFRALAVFPADFDRAAAVAVLGIQESDSLNIEERSTFLVLLCRIKE